MADKRSKNEIIKEHSHQLRGTLAEGAAQSRNRCNIAEDDQQLIKFHGSYIQDDRDVRGERGKKKLEKAYAFMIRLQDSGWRRHGEAMDRRSTRSPSTYANSTMRLTTRETFQFHGVIKSNLKRTMQAFHADLP